MAHRLFLIAGIVAVTAQPAQSVLVSQWQDDEGSFHFQCKVDRTDDTSIGIIKIYIDNVIKLLEVLGDWTFLKHWNDTDITITDLNKDNATVNLMFPASYEGKNVTCMDKHKDETDSLVLKATSPDPDNGIDTGDDDTNSTTLEEYISPSVSIANSTSLTMQTSTNSIAVMSTTGTNSSSASSNAPSPTQSASPTAQSGISSGSTTSVSGAGNYTNGLVTLIISLIFTLLIL